MCLLIPGEHIWFIIADISADSLTELRVESADRWMNDG